MPRTVVAMVGSLALMIFLIWLLKSGDTLSHPTPKENASRPDDGQTVEISLFCAASNQAVMEAIRKQYEQETGRRVVIQYGASQTLLSQIEVTGSGDLFLPADDAYLTLAREKNLVNDVFPVAKMQCGVAVPKGNPKQINSLRDLFRSDIRLVQANPETAAVGRLTREVTGRQGLWEQLHTATVAYRTTVSDVTNDLIVGAADTGIVYDVVLHDYPQLEFVNVPELSEAVSQVSLGVLVHSRQPVAALHFAKYVTDRDRGLLMYSEHGFHMGQTGNADPVTDAGVCRPGNSGSIR